MGRASEEVDNVNHPKHYQSATGLEVIDVIKAFTDGLNGIQATDTGNVIKYICRWHTKNGIEDLKKAKWYLEHLILEAEKSKIRPTERSYFDEVMQIGKENK